MEYKELVLDRNTGELITVSKGDWITVSELGELRGVTAILVRAILRKMDFLYLPGDGTHRRHRLSPWVINRGFGKFIPAGKPRPRYPFDVIGPAGRKWIEERWSDTIAALDAEASRPVVAEAHAALKSFVEGRLSRDLDTHGRVRWLLHHFRGLTHTEIGTVIGVTQQLVSKYAGLLRSHIQALEMRRDTPLDDLGSIRTRLAHHDDQMPSGGSDILPKPTTNSKTTVMVRSASRQRTSEASAVSV